MNIIDIIIIAVVIVGFILGYKDGFVRKIIGLIGFGAAIFLAVKFAAKLGETIDAFLGIEFYLSKIIGGIILFFFVIVVFAILKRIIHPFDKVNNFINQFIGGLIGAVQILFFLSGVFYLLNVFEVPSKNAKGNSLFYARVYNIIPETVNYLNSFTPKTNEFIKEYINQKDSV